MLKKKCVTGGLVIAAAAGTLLTGSAASAQPTGGWGHFRHHFRSFGGNGNWNGNQNIARNRIRIRIRNRNNNVAVARNEQLQRQRQREREREVLRQRPRRVAVTREECVRGGGRVSIFPPRRCIGGIFNGLPVVG